MVQFTSRSAIRVSRREEFLGVAARLFAERGYAGVTMDDIGSATGVSGPALYHHFSGKEALLGEMLLGISEHLLQQAERTAERVTDPNDALRWLIADQTDFALDHPELITVHARDLVHTSDADRHQIRQLQSRYVQVWAGVLVAANPTMTEASARTAVQAMIGLINSTPHIPRTPRSETRAMLSAMALAAAHAAGRIVDRAVGEGGP